MARKSEEISILQFDEHVMTVLRARPSAQGIDILAFEQERGVWSFEDGSLESALRQFAKTHHVGEGPLYSVLPRHNMTTRILTLPTTDAAEAAGMVRLSAEEFAPYPAHELVIDQCMLQQLPDGQSRVLAVFVHHDVVDTHVRVLRAAGLEPERVLLSSACLASAMLASREAWGGAERGALVNLASGGIEVLVFHGAQLEYVRGIVTSERWTDGTDDNEAAGEELGAEVRASLSAYRRESEDGVGVETVLLVSDTADARPWCDAVKAQVNLPCATMALPRGLSGEGADRLPYVPLVSLGAALTAFGRAKVLIDLTPASLTSARRKVKARAGLVWAAVSVALIIAGAAILYAQAIHQRRVYLAELESRVREIKPKATAVASKQKLLHTLSRQIDKSGTFLELLARMSELAPRDGINIVTLHYTHRESIVVEGTALSDLQVNRWQDSLRRAGQQNIPQFAQAQNVQTSSGEKVYETEVVNYKLHIPFPIPEVGEGAASEEAAAAEEGGS